MVSEDVTMNYSDAGRLLLSERFQQI